MKNYIISLLILSSLFLVSCESDTDPGGTAVEKMAGDWIVTWEVQNASGEWKDVLGGTVMVNTYNTAANVNTEMWLSDDNVIEVPLKVKVDYNARKFDLLETVKVEENYFFSEEEDEKENPIPVEIELTIEDGEIIENGAVAPHDPNVKADSIVFFVNVVGQGVYRASGYRMTGFE